MSRFLSYVNPLDITLNNLSLAGNKIISDIGVETLIDETTGKLKTEYTNDLSINKTYVVADETERNTLDLQEGDGAKLTSTGQYFIWSGVAWIEVLEERNLNSLNDVTINALTTNDTLTYNGSQWVNNSTVQTHLTNTAIHYDTTQDNVKIGDTAGNGAGTYSINLGKSAGTNGGNNSINIGFNAGSWGGGSGGDANIAIGKDSGVSSGDRCLFAGCGAGPYQSTVSDSTCIGYRSGYTTAHDRTTIINSSGVEINSNGTDRLFIAPIRNASGSNVMYYNTSTKEITYSNSGGGASTLDDLTDVVITSASDRQILNHNGTNWINTATPEIDRLDIQASDGVRMIKFLENSATWYDFLGNYTYWGGAGLENYARWGCSLYASQSYQITKGDPSNTANYLFTCDGNGNTYHKGKISVGGFVKDFGIHINSGSNGIFNDGTNQFSSVSTAWTLVSSRKFKRDIVDYDKTDILAKLSAVKIKKFKYLKSEEEHCGIIAEDLLEGPFSCCIKQMPKLSMHDNRNNIDVEHENVNTFEQDKLFWAMLQGIQVLTEKNTSMQNLLEVALKRITDLEAIVFT
jgi:hypothetical protein